MLKNVDIPFDIYHTSILLKLSKKISVKEVKKHQWLKISLNIEHRIAIIGIFLIGLWMHRIRNKR